MIYLESVNTLTVDQIGEGFFAGWPNPPTRSTHLKILRKSSHVVVAWDEAEEQVVGFITAISDGVLTAYIPLFEVLPTYQNQGIGHMLVRRMLARLSDIYMIDVVCDPGLQSFYEKVGMTPLLAMSMRNYSQQAGIAGP